MRGQRACFPLMNTPGTLARSIFLALACLSAVACDHSPPDVVITHATFGVYRTRQAGQVVFEPSNVVPRAAGQQYGWLMRLKTSRPRIRWREELTLPSAPKTWGSERIGSRTIAADNQSVVTERDVRTGSGYIFNAWKVEPGDPLGHYTITVSIEDGPSRTFAFEVE